MCEFERNMMNQFEAEEEYDYEHVWNQEQANNYYKAFCKWLCKKLEDEE